MDRTGALWWLPSNPSFNLVVDASASLTLPICISYIYIYVYVHMNGTYLGLLGALGLLPAVKVWAVLGRGAPISGL